RYRLLCPKRKAGHHRQHDNDDLKCLLRIAHLYHNGHKISKLARLSEQELCGLALSTAAPGGPNELLINQLMETAIDFDQDLFSSILHPVTLHMGFEKAV